MRGSSVTVENIAHRWLKTIGKRLPFCQYLPALAIAVLPFCHLPRAKSILPGTLASGISQKCPVSRPGARDAPRSSSLSTPPPLDSTRHVRIVCTDNPLRDSVRDLHPRGGWAVHLTKSAGMSPLIHLPPLSSSISQRRDLRRTRRTRLDSD